MNPLHYMTYYEVDPVRMTGWVNLAHDWDVGLLVAAAEQGVRMLPDVSNVFFFQPFVLDSNGVRQVGPLSLRPDYARTWKCFSDLVRPLVREGRVEGFFVGDELLWSGGAHPSQIRTVTSAIRATFSPTDGYNPIILYLNEYTNVFSLGTNVLGQPVNPDGPGNHVTVTELGVTHISIDDYRSPGSIEQVYTNFLYPRMSADQKAFVVPQAFASTYDPWESGRQAAAAAQGYLEWARRDPKIVGVNPWHWFSYEPFGCQGRDMNGYPVNNSMGTLDLVDVRNYWRNAGIDVIGHSPRPVLPALALPLVHRFESFSDGEPLPSTFGTDPDGRGGTGLSDPSAPLTEDVCFSRARGTRTSIMMKRASAAFRYSWGNIPRVFSGLQWISPRTGVQVLRFSLWVDTVDGFGLTASLQFGSGPIVSVDMGQSVLRQELRAGMWNDIECRLDLNQGTYSVAVGGLLVIQDRLNSEQTATEVLFVGGPAFISELELRCEPVLYSGAYRSNCQTPAATALSLSGSRIGLLAITGDVVVKDIGTFWLWETSRVVALFLEGSRIGVLDRDGNVFVKEGALDAAWTWESGDVAQLVLNGSRIGVLHRDGNVFVKEGALDAAWTWESGDVAQLVLNGSRIGVLGRDGNVFVKEGALDAAWTWESGDVTQLVLNGSRIGVLGRNGDVFVKEGALDAAWTWESGDVTQLVLNGSRIGVLDRDGNLFVKEGALDTAWTREYGDVTQLVLNTTNIGVLRKDGMAFVKSGPLNAPWSQLNGSTLGE